MNFFIKFGIWQTLKISSFQPQWLYFLGLFLRNLAYSCNEEQLRELCSPFGPLADVECIVDRTGKCKGFALCTFMFPEHALAAWKALDGTIFMVKK